MRLEIALLCLLGLYACSSDSQQEEDQPTVDYLQIGDSLSLHAQQTLLGFVSNKVRDGGTSHAIHFCNLNAIGITDSLSKLNNVEISRISEKFRNPNNEPSATELKLLHTMEANNADHTLVTSGSETIYYKTIRTGMPTCLLCHGNPETEINSDALKILQERYPNDNATGYQIGDFRGAWKIVFKD